MKKPVKKTRVKRIDDSGWTGQYFWTCLQKLGFSQVGFAEKINVSDRTVRAWIGERYPVPTVIAMLINLMLKTKSTAEDLKV
jgi:DNA-binding transcriptional regulator YiaG